MSSVTQWIREHLVIVFCIAVMILSVVGLFWPVTPQIARFKDQLAGTSRTLRDIESFMNRNEEIPSDDPEAPMRPIRLTINDASVEALNSIYDMMHRRYEQIIERAVSFNRQGHELMLDGLFPTTSPWSPGSIVFRADDRYRAAFQSLYDRLNAGTPPDPQQIQARLQEVEDQWRAKTLDNGAGGANESELQQLKVQARIQQYIAHAESGQLSVYAEPPNAAAEDAYSAGVFQATELASRSENFSDAELWVSQMQLWIQQDIADAIVRTNADPQGVPRPVAEAPIKRILSIRVDDFYLLPPVVETDRGTRAEARVLSPDALDEPLSLNFRASETGRVSNALYDVWRAEVRLIIESAAIPRLLNKLGQVNFITPVAREIAPLSTPIDEQFSAGYVYGETRDLVELQLELETLWMRQWTAGSFSSETAPDGRAAFGPMPDIIRVRLGMPARAEDFNPDEDQADRPRPGGPGGGYGGQDPYR